MEKTDTMRFTVTVGALIRKDVIRHLKNAAFQLGLEINVDESSSLLSSDYRITVKGTESKLHSFNSFRERLLRL